LWDDQRFEKPHGFYILFRSMAEVDVHIRRAADLKDYNACVELQKQVWGFTEAEDVAGVPMLMIANRQGGSVLIAEDSADRFIGFSFALPGWTRDRKRLWWSHMTAVVQNRRGQQLGLRLKMRQREEAILEGIDQIHWTFDPLQAMNGHFNIQKLGAVVRKYEENIYGSTSSALHMGLPTDRFVAEWHLNSERVKDRLRMSESTLILRDLDRMLRINAGGDEPNLQLSESPLLLEVPVDLTALKTADLARAKLWQDRVRTACLHYFKAGYLVTDFFRLSQPRPQALYVLEKQDRG
jgi:predicted GNAT superfamily acetyltransferase